MGLVKNIALVIDKLHRFLSKVFLYIGILLMASMTLAILVQVMMRYVVGNPIAWIEEFCVYAMFVMAFILAPFLMLYKLNISMTLFYDKITNKKLKLVIDFLLNLLIIIGGIIVLPSLLDIVQSNMSVSNAQVLLSKGQIFLVAPISFILIVTITVGNIVKDIIAFVMYKELEDDTSISREESL